MASEQRDPPPALDWGLGEYERTAAQLLPAAELVVERAGVRPGERVLDVGCGTGNAALLAAARGASVTGVDPAPRLLEVARGRAAEEGLEVAFLAGDAAHLPVADGSADAILSVFAVIFAPDAEEAAAELARAAAPDGRIVLAAWIPGGAISQVNRIAREAVQRALGGPPGPAPFAWHEADALTDLFGPHGFAVAVEDHSFTFTGPSPREYLEAEMGSHPLAIAGRRVLEQHPGASEEVFRQALEVLEDANEADAGFRVTSRYVIAAARRAG